MHPYKTFKLTECPDVADIQNEGRKSSVGRVRRDHGYIRTARKKAATRRGLKRADKQRVSMALRLEF